MTTIDQQGEVTMNQPLAIQQDAPSTAVALRTPMDLLSHALQSGASMEVVQKIIEFSERLDANQARKAFDEAISAAKADIPTISKNRVVDFTSQKGRTHYRHEDLGEIARTVDPILSRHGLSYRFRATSAIGEPIAVTCIVSHRLGHSEETTLFAGRDESGNKNSIQAIGSTVTYLQRYTLKVALGLAASNDDDAKDAGDGSGGGLITSEQVKTIESLITETKTDLKRFCGYMKVETIADITSGQYQRAVDALSAKKQQAAS